MPVVLQKVSFYKVIYHILPTNISYITEQYIIYYFAIYYILLLDCACFFGRIPLYMQKKRWEACDDASHLVDMLYVKISLFHHYLFAIDDVDALSGVLYTLACEVIDALATNRLCLNGNGLDSCWFFWADILQGELRQDVGCCNSEVASGIVAIGVSEACCLAGEETIGVVLAVTAVGC